MSLAGSVSRLFSHGLMTIPALRWPHTYPAFHGWSECMGHARIGFPWLSPSSSEFQPQWLTNAAVAPCARISSCGAHPVITSPLPSVRLVNSDISLACRLSPASAKMSARSASRSTQMNRCSQLCSAPASSSICLPGSDVIVPKHRYSTDDGGCLSSQSMHSCRGCMVTSSSSSGFNGPMENSFLPSRDRASACASTNSPSSARHELRSSPAPGTPSPPCRSTSPMNASVRKDSGDGTGRPSARTRRWLGSLNPAPNDCPTHWSAYASPLGSRDASVAGKATRLSCTTTTRRCSAARSSRRRPSGAAAWSQNASKSGCRWAGNATGLSGSGGGVA
uniref:Uncharacterized protein n=1 Tax=Triticum urartu TaxID=4572 RepID=A0A8R7TL48_TRIUA